MNITTNQDKAAFENLKDVLLNEHGSTDWVFTPINAFHYMESAVAKEMGTSTLFSTDDVVNFYGSSEAFLTVRERLVKEVHELNLAEMKGIVWGVYLVWMNEQKKAGSFEPDDAHLNFEEVAKWFLSINNDD
jgi:hypothetical protein